MFKNNLINNELDAYLLGFFYADGTITGFSCGKYRLFSITVAEKDKEYLQWICNTINEKLNKNYSLKYNENTKSYKISIGDGLFIQKLISLGIVHNKTYEENDSIFINIPDNYKRHFIRGYFDGDGSIIIDKNNKARLNIVSLNNSLMFSIYQYIQKFFNVGKLKKENYYLRIVFSGNPSVKGFLDWLYDDANFYMKRKYNVYQAIPVRNKKYNYKNIKPSRNKEKYIVSISHNNINEYLGTFSTIYDALMIYNDKAREYNKEPQLYTGENLYAE